MYTTNYPISNDPGDRDEGSDGDRGTSSVINNPETKEKPSHDSASTATFRDFLLKPELIRALIDCDLEKPSEVQQNCLQHSFYGTDTLCRANSGTGKTTAFVLSTLQQLHPVDGEVSAIVLCDTSMLVHQIKGEYTRLGKYLPDIRIGVFDSKTSLAADEKVLKDVALCPHIAVGIPARFKNLIALGLLQAENIKHVVLDECDKIMEDDGMRLNVYDIFKKVPRTRQVLMFGATMNDQLRNRCKKLMHNPQEISVDDDDAADRTLHHSFRQYYLNLTEREKIQKLGNLLYELEFNQVCIFVQSSNRAEKLDKILQEACLPSTSDHSQLTPGTRITRFKDFKEFKKRIVVSTDTLSRCVDVSRVNVVVNYDFPQDADTYFSRVGRAGRFGTKGIAISFVSSDDNRAVLRSVHDRFRITILEMPANVQPYSQ
ncbi:Suppressor of the cold-sensitive snRNP biogenesis mutant brr1-1 [Podila epicladia]|nr:Suppressor of the cold-sensitive snRNP biogenesis mutant brr1-1 [Podila epicladia]KAG0088129.1 Suppressor of the cold-sensitive snRNP biogenesis mutant brr1-1 [Podila epicladia]